MGNHPLKVEINRDFAGRSKGSALASFATNEEAQRVVSTLDNVQFLGMKLTVRLDAEKTAVVATAGPVIVNGSSYQVCAQHCADDEVLNVTQAQEPLSG